MTDVDCEVAGSPRPCGEASPRERADDCRHQNAVTARTGKLERREIFRALAGLGCALAATRASHAFAKPRRRSRQTPLIVLDPGHGGADPGAIGVSGVYEKNIALATALGAARKLESTRRYRVYLTRKDDVFVPLRERVARARAAGGDLFLSIHANALPIARLRGASVFTLSETASDEEAAELATSENKADLVAGIDLSRQSPEVSEILLDLARRETNNQSIRFARELVAELRRHVALLHNGQRSAGFAVLKAPDVPSALVELGCLSNREEERLLQRASYQHVMAASLIRAVDDYFDFRKA